MERELGLDLRREEVGIGEQGEGFGLELTSKLDGSCIDREGKVIKLLRRKEANAYPLP